MALAWQTARRTLTFGARPWVMGIVNATPDSFSDGGRFLDPERAIAHALALETAGADLIDVGAESTRPGAAPVPEEEEMRRLWPVLEGLRGRLTVPLAVDTTKAAVAEGALRRGAEIVNDVSGGRFDPRLWPVVAAHGAGYILTHSRGTPQTMRKETAYGDVAAEVAAALGEGLERAAAAGIAPERIALDPGFGFAKTAGQNWSLLAGLDRTAALGRPVVAGVSRKSFLKSIAGEELLQVSTGVAETLAALRGAHVWRTHDAAAARAASRVLEEFRRAEANA